jgi:outer membrane protein
MKATFRLAAVSTLALLLAGPSLAAHHKTPKVAQVTPAPEMAPVVTPPPAKPSLTLDEALAVAYETNPQLAAQQASLRATDEGVAIANGAWRPNISAGGTYGYQHF